MPSERSPAPYIAITVLIALIVTAIGLVVVMWMRPSVAPATALVATDRAPIDCTAPSHDTTCFDTQITNQGSQPSGFSCRVTAFGDTAATFGDGSPAYTITLGASEAVHVATIVTVTGNVEAVAPRVSCVTVPS